jgi:hypothetical protein
LNVEARTDRILDILKPARIWVGRRRWVLLRTMSKNSVDVGMGAISFHWVFILTGATEKEVGGIYTVVVAFEVGG